MSWVVSAIQALGGIIIIQNLITIYARMTLLNKSKEDIKLHNQELINNSGHDSGTVSVLLDYLEFFNRYLSNRNNYRWTFFILGYFIPLCKIVVGILVILQVRYWIWVFFIAYLWGNSVRKKLHKHIQTQYLLYLELEDSYWELYESQSL